MAIMTKNMGKNLSFSEIKQLVKGYLKTALDIDEFTITFAAQEPSQWRIAISYLTESKSVSDETMPLRWPTTAILRIDSVSGDLKEFKTGYTYSS